MSVRYGMAIDLELCTCCHSCAIACKVEHGTPKGIYWSKVLVTESGKFPATKMTFLPTLCMHCQDAPCLHVCPTGATYKRKDGIVLVDYDKCMGCRYCELACPYDARVFIEELKAYQPDGILTPYEERLFKKHQLGVEEKCKFCVERIDNGQEPTCVQTCPSYARFFGDLNDPNSEVSRYIAQKRGRQLLSHLGTDPSVFYVG